MERAAILLQSDLRSCLGVGCSGEGAADFGDDTEDVSFGGTVSELRSTGSSSFGGETGSGSGPGSAEAGRKLPVRRVVAVSVSGSRARAVKKCKRF